MAMSSLVPGRLEHDVGRGRARRAARRRAPGRRGRRARRASAPQRRAALGHRVEVADDQVGLVADLEQGVGAAVDADEHRPHLADVAAAQERARSLLVVDAPHDDRARGGRAMSTSRSGMSGASSERGGARWRRYSRVFSAKRSSSSPMLTLGRLDAASSSDCQRLAGAVGHDLAVDEHVVAVDAHDLALGDRGPCTSGPTSSTSGMPAAASEQRARGSGSGR